MQGFIPRTMLGLGLSVATLAGCAGYREIVDPCWPERWNTLARRSVDDAMNAQAGNGHVLDQTIWNYHFEHNAAGEPTDQLNPAGIEHLNLISRRRPAPDTHIFLATAQDIPDIARMAPEKAIAERRGLDERRRAAIQRYLAIQSGTLVAYNIDIHDPAEVGIAATPITGSPQTGQPRQVLGAYQKYQSGFDGVLSNNSGAGGATTSSPGGGSTGGAPR